MKKRSIWWDLLKSIIVALVIVFIVQKWILKPVKIVGQSMYPSLYDGEVGFSNVLSRNFTDFERFDVVIVQQPDSSDLLVKRLIGMPNEIIEYRDDQLYVNGEIVAEPHLSSDHKTAYVATRQMSFTNDFGPVLLGEHQYFLLGDNRPYSRDSRFYGPFLESTIISKSVYVLLPIENLRVVPQ